MPRKDGPHRERPPARDPRPSAAPDGAAGDATPAAAAGFDLELLISRVLRGGVLLSAAIMFAGLVLLFLHPAGRSYARPGGFEQVFLELGRGDPLAVIDLGILVLVLTPIARVLLSVFVFLRERDLTYTAVTLFVLLVLVASFLLGKAGG
ncbi:MAG: DUF1634 domain-containing protein [Bacillota bacterium]|nr:DUF1634 domain-containing protein [Bacillota bacterium]